MKVGDTIWRFDANHREYQRDEKGKVFGRPIYRSHWVKMVILGETSRSWLVGWNPKQQTAHLKAPKFGPHPGWAFSEREVDDDCWLNDSRGQIANAVLFCKDASALRKVAEAIGWTPPAPESNCERG